MDTHVYKFTVKGLYLSSCSVQPSPESWLTSLQVGLFCHNLVATRKEDPQLWVNNSCYSRQSKSVNSFIQSFPTSPEFLFYFTTLILAGYELGNMTLAAGLGISIVLQKKAIVMYKVH